MKKPSYFPSSGKVNRARFVMGEAAASRVLLTLTLLLFSGFAQAVAGGAGGGDSGGGGGGDGGFILEIIFWIIFSLPFPYNIIALVILAFLAHRATKNFRSASGLNRIPSVPAASEKTFVLPASFITRNPGFAPISLLSKANTAFTAIQQAWSNQDMSPARRWISDGIWQRFNTQFAMMRQLGQTNIVSNVRIRKSYIASIEEDGQFDIAHVGIYYTADDDFVSAKYPQLDRRGPLEILEYWSFVRKAGVAEKDLYHSNQCPSCGAELPTDMGEVARCASCQTVCTLGDYDWVLSEITQADDFVNTNTRLTKSGNFTQRIRGALAADGDFSIQSIEDKASNAYMQIMTAQVTRQPEKMRRFVSDQAFETLAQRHAQQAPFVFNRLYLNSVAAIDHYRADGKDNLVVALKRTAQRVSVSVSEARLTLLDQGMYASNEIMILSRDTGASKAHASLYAHACPACGAPVGDTLDLKCAYCGELLNSTSREWIVTALLTAEEYKALADGKKSAMATGVKTTQLDPLYAARDYVFNNALMMLGIDGELSPDELAFAQRLARHMGYDAKKLTGMFEIAKNRTLALRLPEDRKTAIKVRRLMEKAARADQNISATEQALLDEVGARIAGMAA